MYYARDGELLTRDEWMALFDGFDADEAFSYRTVAQDTVDDEKGREHFVSTVWLGLDHGFGRSEQPLIFETMVFCHDHECKLDQQQWRYPSEALAVLGHETAVALVRSAKGVTI